MVRSAFDIPLTAEEMVSLERAAQSAKESRPSIHQEPAKSILADYWFVYLELLVYQGRIILSGKNKSAQVTQRRNVLKSIQKVLGRRAVIDDVKEFFPTDTTDRKLLEKVAGDLLSL